MNLSLNLMIALAHGRRLARLRNNVAIATFVENLSTRDKTILAMKADGQKQRAIGEALGYSQSYISRLVVKIRNKWRQYSAE